MGCFGSKDKLSKEDMDFLKSHTRYDEATIKEWYKGFKVSKNTFTEIGGGREGGRTVPSTNYREE